MKTQNTQLKDGTPVRLHNTNDEELDGLEGRIEGFHKAGTYPDLPDDDIYMVWVGEELLGEFGLEELEVIR